MDRRIRVMVRGRVQGVSFRVHTQRQAEQLGLAGWVRNLADGSVALEAQGDEARLRELVAWCHVGPRAARVEDVQVEWKEAEEGGDGKRGFEIRG